MPRDGNSLKSWRWDRTQRAELYFQMLSMPCELVIDNHSDRSSAVNPSAHLVLDNCDGERHLYGGGTSTHRMECALFSQQTSRRV